MKWKSGVGQNLTIPPTCCKLSDEEAYLEDQQVKYVDATCLTSPDGTNSYIDTVSDH